MKNQAAVELGRLGGLKGGKARAEKLSPERRAEIAQKAATTRWANRGKEIKVEKQIERVIEMISKQTPYEFYIHPEDRERHE